MHISTSKPIPRRAILKGLGAAMALPALEAMTPVFGKAPATVATPRLAFLYVPNGVNIQKWLPSEVGEGYALSPTLEALRDHRDDFAVLSGLGHPHSKGGHSGADTWLTGADLEGTPGYDYRNTISVDQVAAQALGPKTRLPSLELSSTGGTGKPGHSQTLAFSQDGVPLPAESNPRVVFERLFVDETGASREEKGQRHLEDRSILDAVRGQARSLERKLGKRDREKLDQYLTSVREVEQRVERAENWMDVPKPSINADRLALDAEPNDRGDRETYFRTMYDLIALAFQTDLTRVCSFQLGREAAGGSYDELGLKANHHELSHHGGDEDMLEGLRQIDVFLLEQLGYFLTRLQESDEDGQPLLDQTMIVYGSGMNSGEGGGHSPKNLPLLFAGGRSLGFSLGHHQSFAESTVPLSNLFVSMLQKVDPATDRFMDSTGALAI